MMDLVSLFLSAISILQNIESKATLSEKKEAALEALTNLDDLYKILMGAKNAHDQFQVMQTFLAGEKPIGSDAQFRRLSHNGQMSLAKKVKGMDESISNRVNYRDLPIPLSPEEVQNVNITDNSTASTSLSTALRVYIEFYNALRAHDDIVYSAPNSLEKMIQQDKLGIDLHVRLKDLTDCLDRGSIAADQIIITLTPVIYELHMTVKRAISKF